MAQYRLYFLDPVSGRFQRSLEFEAADHRSALALSEDHEGPQSLELWTDSRKLCRIEATTHPALSRAAQ